MRRIKRQKHYTFGLAALRSLGGLRISPTQAIIRSLYLKAYYAEHAAMGSDVPF